MKTTFLITLLAFLLVSCSNEEEKESKTRKPNDNEVVKEKVKPPIPEEDMSDSMLREHFFPLEEGESINDYKDLSANEITEERRSEKYEYRVYSITEQKWVEFWSSSLWAIRGKENRYKKTDPFAKWVVKVRKRKKSSN